MTPKCGTDISRPPALDRRFAAAAAPTGRERYPVLAGAAVMHIITWLLVGLVAGALAAGIMRGSGFGLFADIVLGIAGAVVGGWTFATRTA